jgi:mRNA interferase MazF
MGSGERSHPSTAEEAFVTSDEAHEGSTVKQYEIWWATLPPPIGTRPVLLLSRDGAYEYLNRVLVAEITSTTRGIPQEVELGPREGLPRRCVANFDNLRAAPKRLLGERAGRVGARRIVEVKRALGYALAWRELTALPTID